MRGNIVWWCLREEWCQPLTRSTPLYVVFGLVCQTCKWCQASWVGAWLFMYNQLVKPAVEDCTRVQFVHVHSYLVTYSSISLWPSKHNPDSLFLSTTCLYHAQNRSNTVIHNTILGNGVTTSTGWMKASITVMIGPIHICTLRCTCQQSNHQWSISSTSFLSWPYSSHAE
jgi:hypothetical protein